MRNRFIFMTALATMFAAGALAQNSYNVLSLGNSTTYNSFLMRRVHEQYAERNAAFENATTSKQAMEAYIANLKTKYKSIVGDFPQRGDLHAQVVGTLKGDGFRIEKIVFQSLPGRYVTANLYMPEGQTKPVPASLELCGHGLQGKAYISGAAMRLVANGIAVMVVDPLGQGERLQLIDANGKPLTRGATTEHTLLNAGLNLMGTSLAAQEFWDNSRALDYLCTRSDIDHDKLGIYGSSGGGTQTAYFLGLDERVKVAAICSFFSSRERTLELMGPSDGCQHIPYEGRERLEVTDFALMMAPKPILILSGRYDFVDLWGAEQGFAQLKKAYTVLGQPDKAAMLIAECGHGMPTEKQLKLVSWFKLQLLGDKTAQKAPFTTDIKSPQLLCTEKGQVNLSFSDAVSLMTENVRQAETWAKSYKVPTETVIRKILALDKSKSPLRIDEVGHTPGRGYEQYKFRLIRAGEFEVPCILIVPETVTDKSSIRLILSQDGKASYLNDFTNITAALTDGTILLAADLRGIGESYDPAFYSDAKYWNFEYRNSMTSMHIGRPIMGQRVADLITILDFCSEYKTLKKRPIEVVATGVYGPVVMHVACLDKRITSASISRSIKSWKSYLSNPMQRDMYSNVLYGVLKYYDLPDLVKACKGRVRFTD
jgi:cephalosporin-C deacetylase-like acetyl esterase